MQTELITGFHRWRDFSGQDLTGVRFERADIYQASFRGAILAGAEMLNCFAAEAHFDGANCTGLQATRCDFFQASFAGANLRGALLRQCTLAGANLRGATLRDITITLNCRSFEDAQLDSASGAQLAYLLGRADSPHRQQWLSCLGPHDLARLERIFAR